MSKLYITRNEIYDGSTKAVDLILNLNEPACKAGQDALGQYLGILDLVNRVPSAPCIALQMEADRPESNMLTYAPVDKEYKNPSLITAGNFTLVTLQCATDDIRLLCGDLDEAGRFRVSIMITSLRKYVTQDPGTWVNFTAVLDKLCHAYLTKIQADPEIVVQFEQSFKCVYDYLNRLIERNAKEASKC